MAEADKESTDGASIKPVSSLRSHFEKIANTSPAPHSHLTGALRFGAHPRQPGRDIGSPERASLDLPRRPSPWIASDDAPPKSSHLGAKAMGPPVTPRAQRPRSTYIQRPASAEPQSPPRAPPTLTVESPKSPPKSALLPTAPPFPPLSSPKPTTLSGLGSRPAPPIPPHSPNYAMRPTSKAPIPIPTTEKYHGASPAPPRKRGAANGIDTALANAAPPVPTASKPKIPATTTDSNMRSGLEPDAHESDKRVSPFNTPPSSENSTPGLLSNKLTLDSPYSPVKTGMENGLSPFSPPPVRQPVNVRYKQDPDIVDSKSRIAASVPRANKDLEDTVERRPGLPPRRVTDKGHQQPSMVQRSDTRIASTSKLQEARTPGVVHGAAAPSQTVTGSKPFRPEFPPPPRRTETTDTFDKSKEVRRVPSPPKAMSNYAMDASIAVAHSSDPSEAAGVIMDYPDASLSNRRPPRIKQRVHELDTGYETKLFDICGDHICTTGYLTRAWDLASGHPIMSVPHGEQTKVTALAFKPGATADQEGQRIWVGTNYGDMMEVDIASQHVVTSRTGAHSRREIVRMHRHQNSMWTLDDGGTLNMWPPDEAGVLNMQRSPRTHRLPRGHTFSIVVHHRLWVATGKDIMVFEPAATGDTDLQLTLHPLCQPNVGEVTSGAVISSQQDRVYFGHTDGKVTIYSTDSFACLGVVNVSVYKINALAGAGDYLWAGFNTGMIYVYDTKTHPWTTKKDWQAHSHPVSGILADRSSVWKSGMLQVASIGTDNAIRLWDGTLEDDWLIEDMQEHDTDYCTFQEMSALVVTWNAGAATPGNLRYEERDNNFFRETLQAGDLPDLLVFGFQELVDLEDKKLTAKSLFKGNKKKDPSEQEHVGRQYRAWRDYLVRCIEDSMPSNEPYHLLHTASLVGLFSCVFVRADLRTRITCQSAGEVKRGMGGLHGNKGCLILRFLIDDSSVCLVNCHLAAGQTQTVHRNNDISAILEATVLPAERNLNAICDSYTNGGDGSMILDHEMCILNGDLNYRIDTMGRDTVVKAIQANNLAKLLERDQLLVSRRRNPLFRLRCFIELPIAFAPTYKYDVGTDRYDTSEKHRAPAWCDRILYRGPGKIKQLDYRRHELRVSDHRPVSATFKMRVKSVVHERRAQAWQACLKRFEGVKGRLERDAKIVYLRDVLGVDVEEAKTLV